MRFVFVLTYKNIPIFVDIQILGVIQPNSNTLQVQHYTDNQLFEKNSEKSAYYFLSQFLLLQNFTTNNNTGFQCSQGINYLCFEKITVIHYFSWNHDAVIYYTKIYQNQAGGSVHSSIFISSISSSLQSFLTVPKLFVVPFHDIFITDCRAEH